MTAKLRQWAGAVRDWFAGKKTILGGCVLIGAGVAGVATGNLASIGIIDESTVNVGDPISITYEGEAYAIAGAAVNAGQYVTLDAQGRCIPSTAIGDNVVGRAVSSAAVANDELVIYVNPFIR